MDNGRVQDHVKSFPAPAGLDATTHNLLLTAIHERRLLRFAYKNQIRIAEPQDYGLQKGVVHLFTYQVGGQSSSGTLPDWRKFAVQNISRLELLDKTFAGSRSVPSHRHQNWDVLFARVD
ncbi:MAG TPA: WYL domain-containing protein [Candidatus Angelobacter sp.]|nr:WYL domain-containing protein [Candidatus Angelobacter sp.]